MNIGLLKRFIGQYVLFNELSIHFSELSTMRFKRFCTKSLFCTKKCLRLHQRLLTREENNPHFLTYLFLFIANIIAEEIMHITKAAMISELSFCEIPIKKSPANITKKKIYAIVSIGADLLNVAKAKIKPRANCRAAHI